MKGNEAWKKIKTIVLITLLVIINFTSFFTINPLKASSIYVESSDSLQDKINESIDGDLVQINSCMTLSDFVDIKRSIILQGKPGEFIQINGSGFGLTITTDNVTIKNITLNNCSTALTIYNQTDSLENITIQNLTISNCSIHGIYACNATQINITESMINNCTSTGIKFNNVSTSNISNNCINQTINTALNLTESSNNNSIFSNTFKNNSIAMNITSSQDNTIYNNTFLNSTLFHAFDNATNLWNTTTNGNYWDNYTGTDSNNDNIGEHSYNIPGGTNVDEKPLGFFVPIVNFSYQPTSPTTANTITFTDNSTDPNYENNLHLNYTWDFDDGNISYEINPTHSYSDNGTYNVTLNLTNNYGQFNITNQTITVANIGATVSFSCTPSIGIVNESITFTSLCSDSDGANESLTYFWDFGDGQNSTNGNPIHSYNQSGEYIVFLNVTDDDSNTTSCHQTITITFRPSANFTINASNPTTSDTITFTDTSTDIDGSISSYNWSFGDGTYSDSQNPTHSFNDDGSYNITLNVTDDDGATNQTNQTITILNTPPIANFSYSPQNATDLQSITFTNRSSDSDGHITNCTWTFGDGTTNYSMNTTRHKYNDNGTYTVTLNITDDDGDTDEYSVNITILNVGPTASFTYEPSYPEVGESIWFNDTSTDQDGSINNWSWDFNDNSMNHSQNTTHSYSNLTSYDVSLTVTDNDGNTSTVTKHIILKKTTTKTINSSKSVLYDLKNEANTNIQIKTIENTNLSVTSYSERPSNVKENISNYENLETYLEITLENETVLDWINFSLYYTEDNVNDDMDETSLTLFYWNETSEEWIHIPNSSINTVDTGSFRGYVQANISHLTLFTLAGKIIEEDDTPTPTLPNIINSSNSTIYSVSTPTLNITYEKIVPSLVASINGTSLLVDSKDNKTFSIFIHTDLQNGNYSVKLILTNSTLSRTDTIYFSIELPIITQKQNNPIEIPIWIWYGIFIFLVIILIIFKKSKSTDSIDNNDKEKNPSQGLIKDTLLNLQQSIKSFDKTFFGSDDPWIQKKAEINQTMYNIDLFTEKPDAYVGIQNQLLTEQPQCKEIIQLISNDDSNSSIEKIKEETQLTKEELSKELTILLKYGLIEEKNEECFELAMQAKKIIEKNKDE